MLIFSSWGGASAGGWQGKEWGKGEKGSKGERRQRREGRGEGKGKEEGRELNSDVTHGLSLMMYIE